MNEAKRLELNIDTMINWLLSVKNMDCSESEKIKRLMAAQIGFALNTLSIMDLDLDKTCAAGSYLSKAFECLIECNGVISEPKLLYESSFSAKEWEACSEERKNSILAFTALAVNKSLKVEECLNAALSFDDYTKGWLKINCPFNDLKTVL